MTMTAAPTPYQPPLTLASLNHIALASKSYRVFGLPSEAWQLTRHDLKKRVGCSRDNENGQEENEDFEMMEICNAVCTALQEDAGGFGTAGFHLVRGCDEMLTTLFISISIDSIDICDCDEFSEIVFTMGQE